MKTLPNKNKICILTSVHPPFDDRIFHKEAKTLLKAGYEVSLIAQHNKCETVDGIKIIALSKAKNRIHRIFGLTLKVFSLTLKQKADVYHLHDPELLPVGVILKLFSGKKIIYDVHEDYKQKILSKTWITKIFRKPISSLVNFLEKYFSSFFDYIVTADSHTNMQFKNVNSEVIANYPPLNFSNYFKEYKKNNNFKVVYAGGISEDRGIFVMVEAMKHLKHKDIELHVLGETDDGDLVNLLNSSERVKYHGCLPWKEVGEHLINTNVGLVLFQPVSAYLYYPGENVIKLFEYMSAGLAVIISDFPKLKKLVYDIGCGVTVDPTDSKKIAEAIEYLYENPHLTMKMGERGKRAVLSKYNWEKESKKLIKIYQKVLKNK